MARCGRVIFALFVLPVAACAESNEPSSVGAAALNLWKPSGLRPVRVAIVDGARRVRVRSKGTIYLVNEDGVRVDALEAKKWHDVEYRAPNKLVVAKKTCPPGFELESDGKHALALSCHENGAWSAPRNYPGLFELQTTESALRVHNLVDIEQYVASVVAYEIWPTFQTETYRAQAVVARTYALYEMLQRSGRSYDVRATQSSQVYRGLREDVVGRRAAGAARYTRGIVLSYVHHGEEELFCTYYSAACGGVTQSATVFGECGDIPPLAGGVHCDYCAIAPGDTYRWGPVRMKLRDVYDRLTKRYPDLRALGGLRCIEVEDNGTAGRPVSFRLSGSNGKSESMPAERFRMTVGPDKLKSSDFKISCAGGDITFSDGHGFGHGIGLCQWGAEGQARHGRRADQILLYYFPGARIKKAYD